MITKIEGVRVGHATDPVGITGCTVILFDVPTVGGVDVRGPNPGTLNTDLLRPTGIMPEIHGIALTGGSTFGLSAAQGVVEYLEKQGRGFDVKVAKIPVVSAAVIYDLSIGNPSIRPTHAMGIDACLAATDGEFERGSIGAGTGATFGKLYGVNHSTKGGIGTSLVSILHDIHVGALVVVNAFGDVLDPTNNKILGGTQNLNRQFVNTLEKMKKGHKSESSFQFENTVIGLVATNAKLTKLEANRVATMAHNGIAKVISPAHANADGDVIFATGRLEGSLIAPIDLIGNVAAEAMSLAIIDAIRNAKSLGGIFSISDIEERQRLNSTYINHPSHSDLI